MFIKRNYLPPDHPIPDREMLKAMEDLFVRLTYIVIKDTRHEKYPYEVTMTETDAFEAYGLATQTDPTKVAAIVTEHVMVEMFLNKIFNIVSKKPWGVWEVDTTVLEYRGDYRILQWELEHLEEKDREKNIWLNEEQVREEKNIMVVFDREGYPTIHLVSNES